MASGCENAYSTAPVDEQASASASAPARSGSGMTRLARIAPWLVLAFAAALLLPGLGRAGLWTLGELPILDRTLAALGEPRTELLRSPWLPDQLRTWAYAASGGTDAGLRLPGAFAGVGLVALTVLLARRLGASPAYVALAGCFALAFPLLLASSRTVLGAPTSELWLSGAVVALVHGLDTGPRAARSMLARAGLVLLGLACLGASIASLGIVLGGCLPLALVALSEVARGSQTGELQLSRLAVVLAAVGAVVAGAVGVWLIQAQGEGYIPLLGASKDLELLEDPTKWQFTDSIERLGYQLFPLTGLVLVGVVAPGRARWPALWLGLAAVVCSLWSGIYGTTHCPVTIPAALVAAAACERMFDTREPIVARRVVLFFAILAALILAKDAARTPAHIAAPLLELGKLEFPADGDAPGFSPGAALAGLAKGVAGLLLLAHLIAPPSLGQRQLRAQREPLADPSRPRWRRVYASVLDRLAELFARVDQRLVSFERARQYAALALVMGSLGLCAVRYVRALDAVGEQMSIAAPLARYQAALDAGELPDEALALYRVRDPGLERYGPGEVREHTFTSRPQLNAYLAKDEPHVALIRRSDFPAAFKAARREQRRLYVLDEAHHDFVLVANYLPEGREDESPLQEIVYDDPITLAHETYVRWDPYVELIAWEIEGELRRGSRATMHLIFRVKRSLPAGARLYARLQKGKTSRIAAKAQELTGGVFPPNYWSEGDYIHHALEIEVPWLEVLPGEHEFIVGMRRSEKSNMKVTEPTKDAPGEFGVVQRGKSEEFVVIGSAEVLW